MAKPKLDPDSKTTSILVRVPVALKQAAERKLKDGETISTVVREAMEAVANRPEKKTAKRTKPRKDESK